MLRGDQVLEGGADISEHFKWCVFANCVLRSGRLVPIESMIERFYDVGHLIAAQRESPEGRQVWRELYEGYSLRSREDVLRVLRQRQLPRNRYLHNAIGLSGNDLVLLQREGTPEEIGAWLRDAGAQDGFILDNGGSVFCWAWWVGDKGGYLFRAPDFRPPSSAVLVFALHGATNAALAAGSISPTVI